MCIIVYKPAKAIVTRQTLKNCWSANNDGAGFMWSEDNELHILKGYMSFKSFYRDWRKNVNDSQSAVLHFRIKTHGNIDKANTHPHAINDRVAIAHNGIMYGYGLHDTISDTGMFVKLVLQQLPNNWWKNTGIQRLLEDALGSNKIVLMTNTGEVQIYGETLGEWSNGSWFSNITYKPFSERYCKKTFKGHTYDLMSKSDTIYSYMDDERGNTVVEENEDEDEFEGTEEWTTAYAEQMYAGLYCCLRCGHSIGNISLTLGICMNCNETLEGETYDTVAICTSCNAASVEYFDQCTNCGDIGNPYGVINTSRLVSMTMVREVYDKYYNEKEEEQVEVWADTCKHCYKRKTMHAKGITYVASIPWSNFKEYCMRCYKKTRVRRVGEQCQLVKTTN